MTAAAAGCAGPRHILHFHFPQYNVGNHFVVRITTPCPAVLRCSAPSAQPATAPLTCATTPATALPTAPTAAPAAARWGAGLGRHAPARPPACLSACACVRWCIAPGKIEYFSLCSALASRCVVGARCCAVHLHRVALRGRCCAAPAYPPDRPCHVVPGGQCIRLALTKHLRAYASWCLPIPTIGPPLQCSCPAGQTCDGKTVGNVDNCKVSNGLAALTV